MSSDDELEKTKQEVDLHLLAVGRCINQWAQLEMQLFGLFSLALNTRDDFAAIIFYKDHAFRSKLKLADEIVEARLAIGTPEAEKWKLLCKRIGTKSEYRNRAAHFALWRRREMTLGPDGLLRDEDTGYVARPHPDRLKRPREKQTGIDVSGLLTSVDVAASLHRELAEFIPVIKDKLRSRR
jgi:hypothetical protein